MVLSKERTVAFKELYILKYYLLLFFRTGTKAKTVFFITKINKFLYRSFMCPSAASLVVLSLKFVILLVYVSLTLIYLHCNAASK